jgi:hypothetical protein
VKIEMDEKMHHLKEEITELQTQLEHYKNRCKEQEVIMVDTERYNFSSCVLSLWVTVRNFAKIMANVDWLLLKR